MKKLITIFLTMVAASAMAQQVNICNVPTPFTVKPFVDHANTPASSPQSSKFDCMPTPMGSGVNPTIKTNTDGGMVYWYCLKDGKYNENWAVGTWDRIRSGDTKIDTPISDPSLVKIFCQFQAEMYNNRPSAPVVPAAMVTISIMSYNTTATGLVSSAGVIAKGLACNCTSPLKIGTVTYCTFTGAAKASIRASCAKP